jgi:hypothetical protein
MTCPQCNSDVYVDDVCVAPARIDGGYVQDEICEKMYICEDCDFIKPI